MPLNKATTLEGMKGFDVDLKFGKHFEQVIDDIFTGVTTAEVKTERDKWVNYGNIVIETAYKGKPSGLERTESDVWIHNLSVKGELIASIIIPVPILKQVVHDMQKAGETKETKGGDGWNSKLTLLPLSKLFDYLIKGVRDKQFD